MPTWYVLLLAIVQAITEFMPISSSGHLGLAGFFFDLPYQGLTFDLALHLGTLFAIVAYFWRDLWAIGRETLALRSFANASPLQRMGIGIVLSTIPAALVGVAMPDAFTESLRTPVLIAINLIVFGVLLGLADRKGAQVRDAASLSYRDALLIGAAQALALIPGTSRSGVTMTAAMALGLTRDSAARYSFLMAVPITALACAHGALSFAKGDEAFDAKAMVLGIVVSAVAGVAVIHFLLAILRRLGTAPFVVYRIALGLVVLAMVMMRAP